jgi:drug/metabolite transporter (DMT)-like permease
MAIICLVGLVVFGTFNRIFSKLQTIPMNNYPLAMNLYQCTLYILFYFSYIIPTIRFGTAITAEERTVNKRIFATMGALDAVAGIMQLFAFTYISSGALLVLLLQAAIPVSMLISKIMLKTEYKSYHYVGAVLVIGGLVVSLLPQLQHHDDNSGSNQLLWAGVLIASCIPMALGYSYFHVEHLSFQIFN